MAVIVVVVVAVFLAVGIVIHIIEVVVVEVVVVEVISSNCRSSINQVCMIMVAVRVQMEEEGWMWVHGRWVWAPGERISKMRFREERPFLPWAHAGQRERERERERAHAQLTIRMYLSLSSMSKLSLSMYADRSLGTFSGASLCPSLPYLGGMVRSLPQSGCPLQIGEFSSPPSSDTTPSLAEITSHQPTRGPTRAFGDGMANHSSTQNEQFLWSDVFTGLVFHFWCPVPV
jgi:hypothetical protein